MILDDARNEFNTIVEEYMLPLFDVRGTLRLENNRAANSELIEYLAEEGSKKFKIRFYPAIGTNECPAPFYCEIGTYSSFALVRPATHILRELLKVSEYNCSDGNVFRQRHYGRNEIRRETYKKKTLDLAYELGICMWLAPKAKNTDTLYSLLCSLIEWSCKTYEGKRVPFGVVIDFGKIASEDNASYLDFLKNDSSAVFGDGIFSGILLDRVGRVLSFLTRNNENVQQILSPNQEHVFSFSSSLANTQDVRSHEIFVPYQFRDIAQYCDGSAVGIIVLTNGEILLIKRHAVCFAKRGSKWVCFDWNRVLTSLRPYFMIDESLDELSIQERIKQIYCTILDVSFGHCGGCIAIVLPNLHKNMDEIIKDRFDLCIAGRPPAGMSKENKDKLEVLKYLIGESDHKVRSFFELEKPLRREIMSLDGATVISLRGDFYCAGAMISVSGSSSGGGRTLAAKKLAQLGVGIKISEDGYIEAYGVPLDSTTTKRVPLFKIK